MIYKSLILENILNIVCTNNNNLKPIEKVFVLK